ncbi:MAG: T9SS type A sorting domain-containing protein [Lentimicrobiaceae bacterium]|nr:T9SS type A sorting domain-containing protein [Lentimicrobiaceae bacterium]
MKNFILIFGMMVLAFSAKAQQDEMIISWLPAVDTVATGYGNGQSAATFTPLMEFYVDDLIKYKTTNKSIVGINQIQFTLYESAVTANAVSACKVVILQGKDIHTASVAYTQDVFSWSPGWNVVDLDNLYNVDMNQRLYIGYEVTTSKGSYPVAVANGTDTKQAWVKNSSGFNNLIDDQGYKYVCLIKANAVVEDSPDDEIALASFSVDRLKMQGESITVKGTVKNLGKNPITSFDLSYEVNGVSSVVQNLTGLNIAPNASYSFTHSDPYIFSSAEFYNIVVTVSEPNGVTDITGNNSMEAGVLVYAQKVPRVALHEVFTASTCPPCQPGNAKLESVLSVQDAAKWVCIKYQYYFPGTGDPYFTLEGYERGNFYGGIGAVPSLFGDGTFSINPNSYSATYFNQLVNAPALATMTGSATTNGKTVSLNATITPALTYDNPNLRFFAAIVEKETFENVKTNGETVFHYVMKKFMTSEEGNLFDPLELNKPISLNYSYTFNGDYRLPANAATSTLINHSIEHSVESFDGLMVVYWIQDIVTKEVYQAGKADPNPNYKSRVSVEEIALNSNIRIYPNPVKDNLNIVAGEPVKEVSVYSILGQKVSSYNGDVTTIPVADLAKGMYIITVKTENSVSNQKFIKD